MKANTAEFHDGSRRLLAPPRDTHVISDRVTHRWLTSA
eukprot:CAMPEP_0113326644 /NCGR_PEP_ID=MMETSP0010_2-20120614/18677_1 /TAXON_ID=216773 ORGANISM="Corethron hystrix, Strain 308" /NCGR_SAMPLE_ID=MMETSP0010_2 /ASSEMBLY_ACC=CAM_ASM_000155 /LENGTH=37 /DNA_ID=CAMNT_0000187081 /DNA_START=87 /DNA_END=196 /DNA_ORIENTATION=+ /assembly_acc=CAM_ASM_000155